MPATSAPTSCAADDRSRLSLQLGEPGASPAYELRLVRTVADIPEVARVSADRGLGILQRITRDGQIPVGANVRRIGADGRLRKASCLNPVLRFELEARKLDVHVGIVWVDGQR